jgi:hypothetical protein
MANFLWAIISLSKPEIEAMVLVEAIQAGGNGRVLKAPARGAAQTVPGSLEAQALTKAGDFFNLFRP